MVKGCAFYLFKTGNMMKQKSQVLKVFGIRNTLQSLKNYWGPQSGLYLSTVTVLEIKTKKIIKHKNS